MHSSLLRDSYAQLLSECCSAGQLLLCTDLASAIGYHPDLVNFGNAGDSATAGWQSQQ